MGKTLKGTIGKIKSQLIFSKKKKMEKIREKEKEKRKEREEEEEKEILKLATHKSGQESSKTLSLIHI